jgi:excisionase family DNA binding protein
MGSKTNVTASDKLLHGISESAKLLDLGRSSMYRLVNSGRVRTVKLGQRTLIPHDELERLVAELVAEAEAS